MNFITDPTGREISPTNALPVRDTGLATEREAISGETITFITGAAGFSGKVSADKGPIANLSGDNVGSFWRKRRNLLAENNTTAKVTAVVETATSATVTIVDTERNLEQLFESPAATARAVIELTDRTGGTLYGFIGGVAASSNTYTIDVYSEAALSTQSWVGTLSDFSFADGTRFQIYSNESSIAWTTGTILTQEVDLPDNFVPENATAFLDSLSNGQYGVDYARGTIYYKKATVGTTDTIAYSVLKTYQTATIEGTVNVDSQVEGDVAHDAVDSGNPISIGGIARSAQQTAVAAADRVKAVFNLFGELVIAGYTWATNSIRTEEIDPITDHVVSSTLAELTNIAANTTAYLYNEVKKYPTRTYQIITGGTAPTDTITVTHEMTLQDDGTAAASCDYQATTNDLFGIASLIDDDDIWAIDTPIRAKYDRIKYVTSDTAGGDQDLTVYQVKGGVS